MRRSLTACVPLKRGPSPGEVVVIGQTLSHYRITAALGAGGMGEVWRATDVTLGREVAIKVLPTDVAQDPERLGRFQREARLLAALNHPNVAAIYGLENDRRPFLVLELVEGEDLAVRLRRGPVPVAEAIEIARQIAEALEEAHTKGIVHRDLKPANVKLTPDGKVKVLDFGLAKAYAGDTSAALAAADVSQSPTLARSGTLAGVILGTAAYMSPEQASGKLVDKRADIWAFGVVLFEMLTGRPLFTGETVSEVLACVIKEEPPWDRLPADCPPALTRLVRRCLRKRVRERLQDIGDARLELSDVGEGEPATSVGPDTAAGRGVERRFRERSAWVMLALVSGVLAAVAFRQFSEVPAARPAAHLLVDLPEGVTISSLDSPAVSPDGRLLAFAAIPADGAQGMLWIRPLDSPVARPIPGTEGAQAPFWSPDGGAVGFFSASTLETIRISGGDPQEVCSLPDHQPGQGTWSPGGSIVFDSGGPNARLYAVAATGGEPKLLLTADSSRGESGHSPQFFSDGRRFFFTLRGRAEVAGLYVASLDSPRERRRILPDVSRFWYVEPGRLLFVRGNTLLAEPFDSGRLQVTGEAIPIAQSVESFAYLPGVGYFSASASGVLAYTAPGASYRQLAWVDRRGARLANIGKPAAYGQVMLSPDGRRVAVEVPDSGGNYDLWTIDLPRGVANRVTYDPANERDPVWSPDSRELVYSLDRGGARDLLRKSLVGNDPASVLLKSAVDLYVKGWSADGKSLVYVTSDQGKQAFWALRPDGKAKPELVLDTGSLIDSPQISPDGRWLSYISQESGQWEVYVQPFRRAGERVRVSPEGGGQPRWRADGKEIFYLSPQGRLMAVEVRTGVERLEIGLPSALFEVGRFDPDVYDYAVSTDGQRFLVKTLVDRDAGRRIHVIVNWPSLLGGTTSAASRGQGWSALGVLPAILGRRASPRELYRPKTSGPSSASTPRLTLVTVVSPTADLGTEGARGCRRTVRDPNPMLIAREKRTKLVHGYAAILESDLIDWADASPDSPEHPPVQATSEEGTLR